MINECTDFRTHYIKGDGVYYVLFLTGILSVFSLFMIWVTMDIWVVLIFLLPPLSPAFIILIFKFRKVRLGDDYVENVSLFGKKKIYIKDVNKFGIFVAGSYKWPKVTSQSEINDVDDEDLFLHQIYLTTNTEFDLDSFRPMDHVNFRYRKEIYLRIKEMMERKELQVKEK